ncbi:nuclear pore complex protein DDB_G0274915-like [Armigeres subalbatus]|uniref:nuclear pore complex protein DDB_G0274915-like n=1 Tax=Armigeres subalbatus TaxID=124917 RepID=UPI002ED4511F
MAYDPTINERINPFDKDKIAASRAATAAPTTCSSFSGSTFTNATTIGAPGGYNTNATATTLSSSSLSQPPAATTSASSSSYSSTSIITSSNKGDDNVKDRYNTQQGIRDQSQTGRIEPQSNATANPADTSTTSSYSSETKKQEFGRTKRSSSDAELIFGDKGLDFYKPRFSTAGTGRDFKQSSDSVTDAELIFGTSAVSGPPSASSTTGGSAPSTAFNRYSSYGSRDSSSFNSSVSDSDYIYAKKEERNTFAKSLSVSSEKADVDVTERFRSVPKPYEPPKSATSLSSSGSGKWSNKYDEEDFDLK